MRKLVTSLSFCVLACVLFISIAMSSRRGLPARLLDLYGDTYGIRQLTITGMVLSWNNNYAYNFHISPGGTSTEMTVFTNQQMHNEFSLWWWQNQQWHSPNWGWFSVGFIPAEPYEVVPSESQHSFFYTSTAGWQPMPEYRIYAEYFAAQPLFQQRPLYGYDNHRLLVCVGLNGYIRSASMEFPHWELGEREYLGRQASINRPWWVTNHVEVRGVHLFVPNNPGLFGTTAVYRLSRADWANQHGHALEIDTHFDDFRVKADEIFPIELARGTDEILGLIEVSDGALLIVTRESGFEITHIQVPHVMLRPYVGVTATTFYADGPFDFHEYFISEGSIALHSGARPGQVGAGFMVFDFSDDAFTFWGNIYVLAGDLLADTLNQTTNILDVLLTDHTVYVAYTVTRNPMLEAAANVTTYISAFNVHGEMIGRSQVLIGVEDDIIHPWAPGVSMPEPRRLQWLELSTC